MTVEQTYVLYDEKKKENIFGFQGLVTSFIFEHFSDLCTYIVFMCPELPCATLEHVH